MSARRSLTVLAAAAAVVASPFLTGCEPAAGQQGGTSSSGGVADCDPSGFGPLSGCGSSDTTEQAAEPASATGGCDPSGFGPLSGCAGDQGSAQDQDDTPGFALADGVDPASLPWRIRHELGHKVVAEEFGGVVGSVTLYPDGSGYTHISWFPGDRVELVTVKVAGAVAARTTEGADTDYADVADLLADLPPEEADRVVREAEAHARRIVAERSAEIDRLAADLLADGELDD